MFLHKKLLVNQRFYNYTDLVFIKNKTDDGEDKESTVGGILKKGEGHPAYKQARAMVDKDKPEKKKPKKTNDLSDTKKYITDKGDDEKQKPSPKKLTTDLDLVIKLS